MVWDLLGRSWGCLESSWSDHRRSRGGLGAVLAALGAIMDGQEVVWGDLGTVLDGLEVILGRSWMILRRYLDQGAAADSAQAIAEKELFVALDDSQHA